MTYLAKHCFILVGTWPEYQKNTLVIDPNFWYYAGLILLQGGIMGLFDKVLDLMRGEEDPRPAVLPGRNEHCWCGSGRKYKKCHQHEDQAKAAKACSMNCGPT